MHNLKTIIALLAIGAVSVNASCAHLTTLHPRSFKEPAFSYQAPTGPEQWSSLSPNNTICGTGTQQSPIDIHTLDINTDLSANGVRSIPGSDLKVVIPDLEEGAEFENLGTTIEVIVNGTLRVGGTERKLKQFHFHTPGEHMVDGRAADMEAHFVFESEEGAIAVVGFMLNTNATADSGLFDRVMAHCPEIEAPGSVTNTKSLSFGNLITHLNSNEVLTYSGSLTTPPCAESVMWLISSKPLSIGAEDVEAAHKLVGDNARPVQGKLGDENVVEEEDGEVPAVSTVYETVYACPSATNAVAEAPSTMVTSSIPALVSSLAGAVPTGVLPSGYKNGTMTTMA